MNPQSIPVAITIINAIIEDSFNPKYAILKKPIIRADKIEAVREKYSPTRIIAIVRKSTIIIEFTFTL